MPTKRNYLIKVLDAKIVDVKRALEAKGIKLESIYEMYKEALEPEKVSTPVASTSGEATPPAASPAGASSPKAESDAKDPGVTSTTPTSTPSSTSN